MRDKYEISPVSCLLKASYHGSFSGIISNEYCNSSKLISDFCKVVLFSAFTRDSPLFFDGDILDVEVTGGKNVPWYLNLEYDKKNVLSYTVHSFGNIRIILLFPLLKRFL